MRIKPLALHTLKKNTHIKLDLSLIQGVIFRILYDIYIIITACLKSEINFNAVKN